jgi:hypothetical protein
VIALELGFDQLTPERQLEDLAAARGKLPARLGRPAQRCSPRLDPLADPGVLGPGDIVFEE